MIANAYPDGERSSRSDGSSHSCRNADRPLPAAKGLSFYGRPVVHLDLTRIHLPIMAHRPTSRVPLIAGSEGSPKQAVA